MNVSNNQVNHPAHYNKYSVEAIQVIDYLRYPTIANAVKYVWRCGDKDNWKQDLDKALFYIKHHFNRIKQNKLISWKCDKETNDDMVYQVAVLISNLTNEMESPRLTLIHNLVLLDKESATAPKEWLLDYERYIMQYFNEFEAHCKEVKNG